jgi:hypothetical protein
MAILAFGGRARAQSAGSAVVVLVRPPAAPATVTEALVHLRGELTAAGFSAQIAEVPIGADVRASLERVAPNPDAVALVAVLPVSDDPGAPERAAAEMWVIDRLTGKTVVRRASAEGDRQRTAEILSVRAVELLRASFVELSIMAQRPPAAAAPQAQTATRWADRAIEERQRTWSYGLELGGSVLQSATIGPALLPLVRIERAFGDSVLARLSAAGLGAPVRVATAAGNAADVTQSLLLADACWRFRAGRRVQPLISAGAGALRFTAAGPGAPPAYEADGGTRWAAALDIGGGTRLSLWRRLEVSAEIHAIVADPSPTVRFLSNEVGRAGRPSAMASLTVLGGL